MTTANAGKKKYSYPAVTVDVVIFTVLEGDLRVLLVKRGHPPFEGMWALPGGFVESDESLEAAAYRELEEETGLGEEGVYLEQLYTFGEPGRDPRGRVISVAYLALVSPEGVTLRAGDDAAEAGWFSAHQPPRLAFDHDCILQYAIRRLRYKLEYTAFGFMLLPEEFTLTQLQRAYETILGETLDKRNFRRKILQAGIIEPTGVWRGGGHRPARKYRFVSENLELERSRRLFP